MPEQPCNGRLCMDGIGVDCLSTCLSTTQLAKAVAPKTLSHKTFPAKYAGRCKNCLLRIAEGDEIYVAEDGARHEGC